MRGKTVLFLMALALTAGLALLLPRAMAPREKKTGTRPLLRIWAADGDPAVSAWLRGRAAAWEKQTGGRAYLRKASREESRAAEEGDGSVLRPDLVILPSPGGQPVALRGYALIEKDENAPTAAPAPTGLLFSRPTPVPNQSPAPAPTADWSNLSAVLCPPALLNRVPGAIESADPAGDLIRGRARAALLTAQEAARLPFGFRAYALAEGAGWMPIGAAPYTDEGRAFLLFLLSDASQAALKACGLYSPTLLLYGPDQPLAELIQRTRPEPQSGI